jgi:trans-2-enoyl-CoA reductase
MVVVAACLIGDETGRSFVSVGAKVVGVIGGKGGYGVTSSAVETFVSGVMTKGMTFAAARDEANKIISKSNSYGGQTGRLKLYFSNGVSESSKFSDLNK